MRLNQGIQSDVENVATELCTRKEQSDWWSLMQDNVTLKKSRRCVRGTVFNFVHLRLNYFSCKLLLYTFKL